MIFLEDLNHDLMHPRVTQLPHPVGPPFVARVRSAGVMLSDHPPKPASHTIGGRSVTQPPVATHTRVDAVAAPTQRYTAIGVRPQLTFLFIECRAY